MSLFIYKARSQHGDAVEGSMEANSTDIVASHLMDNGMTPITIDPALKKIDNAIHWEKLFSEKVAAEDLIQFSRQMHSLLKAGVPILSALAGLSRSTKNKTFKQVVLDISLSLEAGRDLATSMREHPGVFSVFYVSMIRIGEATGKLDIIFRQLTLYLDRDKNTRKQIKKAVRYPSFVISAIGIAVVIINMMVIPVFAKMFAKYDAQLPLMTKVLVSISSFSLAYWPYILLTLIGMAYLINQYLKTSKGRYQWDKHKLAMPIVGNIIYRATLARFARLFSMATGAGVPLITALSVVAKALDNVFVEDRILGMQTGIERGESIARTAAASGMFDSLVLQMMTVGDETGSMDELLTEVADYYDAEVEYDIEKLSAAIEPVLTVVIGIIVLILALGVLKPLWGLAGVALGK